jgi:hypothetical protein
VEGGPKRSSGEVGEDLKELFWAKKKPLVEGLSDF